MVSSTSSRLGVGGLFVLFEFDRDVLGDPDAVAQAQGPAVDERRLDAFQAGGLAGVDGGREVVLGQVGEGVLEAGRQEAVLGAGDVEADGAVVAVADGQFGDLLAAVGVAHGGDELADLDLAAGLGDGVHAGFEAGLHGLDDVVQAQALLQVLLGRPAHLAVHDAVVGQVLDELLRDAEQALLGLHHGDGVVEGLEVADQGAGVGGFAEPLPQRDGIGGGQRVAGGLGKFNDGGRAESAVQVVVKGNLGKALQVEVEVRGSVRNSLSHVPTIGSPGAGSYVPDRSGTQAERTGSGRVGPCSRSEGRSPAGAVPCDVFGLGSGTRLAVVAAQALVPPAQDGGR